MAEPVAAADREALSQALVEHGDRLYALALRVTRDPDLAGDAVQEAFATALQRIGDFRGESSLGTWLHRIVYNKSIDLLRHRGRQAPLADEDVRGSRRTTTAWPRCRPGPVRPTRSSTAKRRAAPSTRPWRA